MSISLPQQVENYYKQHYSALDPDKQFHFASRLAAWNQDAFCFDALQQRNDITHDGNLRLIQQDLKELLTNPPLAKVNAASTRQLYFDRYPQLRGSMLALFRVRHLLTIYNIDARKALLELRPLKEFLELSEKLQNDRDALKILSTYAINYIYLIHSILFSDSTPHTDIAQTSYEIGMSYTLDNPEQVQLLIYLYTHCIIGETNFYQAPVTRHVSTYQAMIQQLESIMRANYTTINLDNKLEFLVCAQILQFQSSLFERIYDECNQSISPDGMYLVDTINSFHQSNKTSFSDSEHRNVLYIMSQTPFIHQQTENE